MPALLTSTLLKAAIPAASIGMILFVARKRRLFLAEDVGLRLPRLKLALLFLLGWGALIALEEVLTAGVADAQAKAWPDYPTHIVLLRILAIGLLGPIAEELAFRGVLFAVLRRTSLQVAGAIVVTAAFWSVLHLQYSPLLLGLIFIDGLVLGAARHWTRSLYVPIVMHIAGNLFSIGQSLGG